MTKKVDPIREKTHKESSRAYDDLFADPEYYIKTKLKARGIHDLIFQIFCEDIRNKKILDLGCGYGRFSFIASTVADFVVGIDMTESAIGVAEKIKESLSIKNVDFSCQSIEQFKPKDNFDLILLSGTLEHIIEAAEILPQINRMLSPGGIFITDSPSEFNFRGIFHASLWKLFNFPMTLSDVRIVTPRFMDSLAKEGGFEIVGTVGTLYSRGWGSAGADDLKLRMRNVLKDVAAETSMINISHEAYDAWVDEARDEFQFLLDDWVQSGMLEEIPKIDSYGYTFDDSPLRAANLPVNLIHEYMAPDFSIDPFFSRTEPVCRFGGNTIYILRKI